MSRCPKCQSTDCIKDGIVKQRQRYKCKKCSYRHTVQNIGKDPCLKRQALQLYLEGLGFRSIGRFLKCSHVAVYNWIKSYGASLEQIRSSTEATIMELDEMHTYIGSKKTTAGFGLLLIEMGESLSTAKWAHVEQRQVRSCGGASNQTQLSGS